MKRGLQKPYCYVPRQPTSLRRMRPAHCSARPFEPAISYETRNVCRGGLCACRFGGFEAGASERSIRGLVAVDSPPPPPPDTSLCRRRYCRRPRRAMSRAHSSCTDRPCNRDSSSSKTSTPTWVMRHKRTKRRKRTAGKVSSSRAGLHRPCTCMGCTEPSTMLPPSPCPGSLGRIKSPFATFPRADPPGTPGRQLGGCRFHSCTSLCIPHSRPGRQQQRPRHHCRRQRGGQLRRRAALWRWAPAGVFRAVAGSAHPGPRSSAGALVQQPRRAAHPQVGASACL